MGPPQQPSVVSYAGCKSGLMEALAADAKKPASFVMADALHQQALNAEFQGAAGQLFVFSDKGVAHANSECCS